MQVPRHRLDSGTWGVMGIGMGYAIAAAVESGEPVVAIEGDSAFGFSGMELEAICRYNLPIVTVILNNGGVYRGDDPSTTSDPAPTALRAQHEYMIKAFGGKGYHATTPEEVADRAARGAGLGPARPHRLCHRPLRRHRERQHRPPESQGHQRQVSNAHDHENYTNRGHHDERNRLMTELPLAGIKVIDFTGVQAGPACTQMLAWFGADVLKVERPAGGDVTRNQLRDIPDVDALYFTMLNSNKRSLAIDTKSPEGLEVMEKLIRDADVLVENFAPGAMDRMGLSWDKLQEWNPRLIFGSVKGFNDDSSYTDLKVYENVAQCAGGAASTTGFWDGPPTVSGAALGDSNTGMHLLIGILTAIIQRDKTGKGQKVSASMQDSVLNLCRVKLRDQQRLEAVGYLEEYPQYPNGEFGDAVPRGGNAGGGGQPGWVVKCKGWETDPNAYIYFTIQEQNWKRTAEAIGHPEWVEDEGYSTARARQDKIFEIFGEIEKWLADKTKWEAVDVLREWEVPCAPVMSMKDLANDQTLRTSRKHRRGGPEGPRHLPHRRQPDQVLVVQARDRGCAVAR